MATATASKVQRYVVLADAIVVTLGRKNNGRADYTRVLRGGVINGNPESEQIKTFLSGGSIRLVKDDEELARAQADLADPSRSRLRQTARKAAAKMGAPDDPVAKPQDAILPLPAGDPTVDPGNLGVED